MFKSIKRGITKGVAVSIAMMVFVSMQIAPVLAATYTYKDNQDHIDYPNPYNTAKKKTRQTLTDSKDNKTHGYCVDPELPTKYGTKYSYNVRGTKSKENKKQDLALGYGANPDDASEAEYAATQAALWMYGGDNSHYKILKNHTAASKKKYDEIINLVESHDDTVNFTVI